MWKSVICAAACVFTISNFGTAFAATEASNTNIAQSMWTSPDELAAKKSTDWLNNGWMPGTSYFYGGNVKSFRSGFAVNAVKTSGARMQVTPNSALSVTSTTAGEVKSGAAEYSYRTSSDWVMSVRAGGRYAGSNPQSVSRYASGTRLSQSIRGYDEQGGSSTAGVNGSVEVYTPQFAPHQRFVAFTAAARLYGVSRYDRGTNLMSAGLGYRYSNYKRGISFGLDYAFPMTNFTSDYTGARGETRWNAEMYISF